MFPRLRWRALRGNLRKMNLGDLRKEYGAGELRRADLDPDPFVQFARWFADAQTCGAIAEPNAMTLATAGADGRVSARIVLLKDWDSSGFRFFTNYESGKGSAIAENPRVALLFHWPALERQVQICGSAEKTSREESEAYFRTRPVASRLGAWASQQSAVISSREMLEARHAELSAQFAGKEIPAPPAWGGYLVRPETIEFWQGRRSRLHDRFRYARDEGGAWTIARLSP